MNTDRSYLTGHVTQIRYLTYSNVCYRSLKLASRSLSEPQVRRVLHLIGIALNEEIARSEIEADHFFQFTDAAKRWNIFDLLGEMLQNTRLTQFKDYIVWLMQRYRELKPEQSLETGLSSAEEEEVSGFPLQ